MPLAISTKTGIIRDLPQNVIDHRVLGRHLELYVEECEEDKVVIDKKVFRKKKSEAPVEDETATNNEESIVTDFSEAGE